MLDIAHTGKVGDEMATVNACDAIVLDWLLPDRDGIVVCRQYSIFLQHLFRFGFVVYARSVAVEWGVRTIADNRARRGAVLSGVHAGEWVAVGGAIPLRGQ